ncbi:MAG: DUF1538 domain-containing protein [Clostridiales bacterium]|nr:DUF1538 domain-containing protein [Clostridiales bacterium]
MTESLSSVLPIAVIVIILHFSFVPLSGGMLGLFIVSVIILILGMGLFTLGADISMMPMGEAVGAVLIKSRKFAPLIILSFLMGVFITIAEPDLQVLAQQIKSIPNMVLVITVALGVGVFLVVALLRILFQIRLSYLLVGLYGVIFIIAIFASREFLPLAFDSGGVTTGPITVPFILALGIGVASVRGGKTAQEDSFGLVGICSIGPILAILVLNMFFRSPETTVTESTIDQIASFGDILRAYAQSFPHFFKEVAIALSPIVVFFVIFQIFFLKLPKERLIRMAIGIIYTYLGLVLFLTGVNVGFLPIGTFIGQTLGSLSYNWVLIPLGAVMGFFVVMAEPAVHVLNKQVEEITVGAVSQKSMLFSLSIGVGVSIALSMIRVLTGISIWWFILPGYTIALVLSFFVPKVFTAVAFDSGGVASGPMTATFMLPFTVGACSTVGGNLMTDAFGIVAMVAMTPLITIQALGLIYKFKTKNIDVEVIEEQTVLEEIETDEVIAFDEPDAYEIGEPIESGESISFETEAHK